MYWPFSPEWWPLSNRNAGRFPIGTVAVFPPERWPFSSGIRNMLLLRQRTADARGFGEEIKLPVLAKLMLAERFLPSLFDQIATIAATHPQGRCPDLAKLEKLGVVDNSCAPKLAKKSKAVEKENPNASESTIEIKESAILLEWKASESILTWARVQPSLGEIDFRPYLFVTKDKKDYFGSVSVLGHLATVAEKLFGPKFSVQALELELKQLAQPEAEKIFEAMRTKIISGDAFHTQPAGIDGMVVLVKAQQNLQSRLLDFLHALPSERCGPWIVGGWDGALKDPDTIIRFNRLIDSWSKVTNNKILSLAAASAIKTPRGGR